MYKLGDRVKFLNDVGGGVVTKIVGNNMVHVENEDGFEIPVLIHEIILDAEQAPKKEEKPSVEQFIRQGKAEAPVREVVKEEPPVLIAGNDEPKFYLAFLPENSHNPLEGQTKIYLINDSNYHVLYHYSHFAGNEYATQEAGKLEPNTKLALGTLSQADIAQLPEFAFQLIYFKEKATRLEKPLTRKIAVNPVKFYKSGSFSKSGFFREKVMLFKLNEGPMDKALEELTEKEVKKVVREKEPARIPQLKVETPELVEVDLHIHELLDSTAGLSNKDMLDVQMAKFREKMEEAISDQAVKRIVFIHGLGNGTLKQELRRELSTKYKKYPFQDASFQEYGYGATMVVLRRK
ncbi:DUF2027 domain-containing protein [Gaoshiqia sediminis]|uniref:DUF2027 domain-containing protein n=1 Tax=Gaoshiqia sediminis TaxID=2986998 RepID=A0AA41YBL4_9BACT|nr:DUF2027 domain-containing protein [Gaoshiqia sediminis]MCW0483070.1 DUF2027 domain-containing protein [Gaoshiqia sediminis]